MKLKILSLLLILPLTGCVPMIVMHSMDHDNYSKYVQATNTLNTDREEHNLAPVHVMTFDEWKGKTAPPAQKTTSNQSN